MNRSLFVIRGKLGDSLLAFAALREYLLFCDDVRSQYLLTRKAYVPLFEADFPGKVYGFNSRLEMLFILLKWRLQGIHFHVLAVLWGFGPPIRWLGKLVKAKRKLYLNDKFADVYSEWPETYDVEKLVDPAWQVLRLLSPDLAKPKKLLLPNLSKKYATENSSTVVGVVPVADEPRKCLNPETLELMLGKIRRSYPGQQIWILLNKQDLGAQPFIKQSFAEGVEIKWFHNIPELIQLLSQLSIWYGVDTGLYHLAAALNIRANLFFGPTQAEKIILQEQAATGYRLAALGNTHCEVKNCLQPICLYQAVSGFADRHVLNYQQPFLENCLLHKLSDQQLKTLRQCP